MNQKFIPRNFTVSSPQNNYKNEQKIMPIDHKEIHSGDVIVFFEFDGFEQVITYFTGGGAGHTAMALWMDGELYIIEQTLVIIFIDKPIYLSLFFGNQNGMIMSPNYFLTSL